MGEKMSMWTYQELIEKQCDQCKHKGRCVSKKYIKKMAKKYGKKPMVPDVILCGGYEKVKK